jgi:hypothetical protein
VGIGVSIFLIAIGAILTFGTDVTVSGLNLDVVGVVLMLCGAAGLLMTLAIWGPRRRAASVDRVERPVAQRRDVVAEPRDVVVERRRVYEDPPM